MGFIYRAKLLSGWSRVASDLDVKPPSSLTSQGNKGGVCQERRLGCYVDCGQARPLPLVKPRFTSIAPYTKLDSLSDGDDQAGPCATGELVGMRIGVPVTTVIAFVTGSRGSRPASLRDATEGWTDDAGVARPVVPAVVTSASISSGRIPQGGCCASTTATATPCSSTTATPSPLAPPRD